MSGSRFELKYLLNPFQHRMVLSSLRPVLRQDQFSLRVPDGKYFIRSLYFDSYDYKAYADKLHGEASRIKLRLRTYSEKAGPGIVVKAEIKCKENDMVSKYSANASLEECAFFLKHRRWERRDPVLDEFARLCVLRDLRPRLLVDYRREAYVSKDSVHARVTFDHDVRYSAADELFPELLFSRRSPSNNIVLEIKFKDAAPGWFHPVAMSCELKAVPNSKYCSGIENSQQAVFY